MKTKNIRAMEREEFTPHFQEHVHTAFSGDGSYALSDALTARELGQMAVLENRLGEPFELRLGAFDADNRFIGWSWARQETKQILYMINSAVLPEFQRKGVYSALVSAVIAEAEPQGFQIIYSRHCATKNAVIIPKLKAGFVISKFELSDTHGALVHLHYYTNATRRQMMDYRAGQISANEAVKNCRSEGASIRLQVLKARLVRHPDIGCLSTLCLVRVGRPTKEH